MRLLLLPIVLCLTLSGHGQTNLPDSLDFKEFHTSAPLEGDQLVMGRTIGKLYFSGDNIASCKVQWPDHYPPLNFDTERQAYMFSYLDEPHFQLSYDGVDYQVDIKLIQVDWPGNEINWRMIPRIYFTRSSP